MLRSLVPCIVFCAISALILGQKHAGFMVNVENGTANDYESLIKHVIETVEKFSGITLEREVRIIGDPAETL